MNNKSQPLYVNYKPDYGYEYKIDKSKNLNDYIAEYSANNGTMMLKVYNDTSVEVYQEKKLKGKIYLTGVGIDDVKIRLAGRDVDAEQAHKDSEKFSQEVKMATVRGK